MVVHLGFSWDEIVALLGPEIARIAPEVKMGQGIWRIRAHPNGVRIEVYDDERPFFARIGEAAKNPGPQVHAGRLPNF